MTGLARVIRGHMVTAYENVALWHERDISHSSAERIIAPDTTILIDYMLNRFGNIVKKFDSLPRKHDPQHELYIWSYLQPTCDAYFD